MATFQSTPSGGKATCTSAGYTRPDHVSIHAFRGEGDRRCLPFCLALARFQSTPSGGKATLVALRLQQPACVSIHAFRGEGDRRHRRCWRRRWRFNPRLPGGRRPRCRRPTTAVMSFQSTPSGGKATVPLDIDAFLGDVSIHAFRGEGDRNI